MIDLNGHGHDGTFTGALISIGCALLAIIPSLFEWAKKFDSIFVPFLHLIQGLAACIAIVVGVLTIVDWCSKKLSTRKKKPI